MKADGRLVEEAMLSIVTLSCECSDSEGGPPPHTRVAGVQHRAQVPYRCRAASHEISFLLPQFLRGQRAQGALLCMEFLTSHHGHALTLKPYWRNPLQLH